MASSGTKQAPDPIHKLKEEIAVLWHLDRVSRFQTGREDSMPYSRRGASRGTGRLCPTRLASSSMTNKPRLNTGVERCKNDKLNPGLIRAVGRIAASSRMRKHEYQRE